MNHHHLIARDKFKPNFKLASRRMRAGTKKSSKAQILDRRVYSYDELIEYRPRLEDSDDDSFWFNLDDAEKEF